LAQGAESGIRPERAAAYREGRWMSSTPQPGAISAKERDCTDCARFVSDRAVTAPGLTRCGALLMMALP
jgi:hypothetical protein